MTLPSGFNEWEHLQDMIRRYHNQQVTNYFKNQPDDDISTPKRALKHACKIKDNDTVAMTQLRMWLFEVTCGHAASMQPAIYGTPVQELERNVTFKPQVKLFFQERLTEDSEGRGREVRGEITFRLMNKTSSTISRTDAENLARDIKREFANPIFVWEKGWYKATYLDVERGYDLRLFVKSKLEGERVIKQVLKIQEHNYNSEYFQFVDHERSYSLNPGTHLVYGRSTKKPVKRPRVDIRFKYAQLLIWGKGQAVNLVATPDARLRSVIERVNAI